MTGEQLHRVWTLCWFIISPAILVALIVLSLYDMTDPDRYIYSTWEPSTVRINSGKDGIEHVPFNPIVLMFDVIFLHSGNAR
jgi:hypothetical protein